jgi:hypothetical protein
MSGIKAASFMHRPRIEVYGVLHTRWNVIGDKPFKYNNARSFVTLTWLLPGHAVNAVNIVVPHVQNVLLLYVGGKVREL